MSSDHSVLRGMTKILLQPNSQLNSTWGGKVSTQLSGSPISHTRSQPQPVTVLTHPARVMGSHAQGEPLEHLPSQQHGCGLWALKSSEWENRTTGQGDPMPTHKHSRYLIAVPGAEVPHGWVCSVLAIMCPPPAGRTIGQQGPVTKASECPSPEL